MKLMTRKRSQFRIKECDEQSLFKRRWKTRSKWRGLYRENSGTSVCTFFTLNLNVGDFHTHYGLFCISSLINFKIEWIHIILGNISLINGDKERKLIVAGGGLPNPWLGVVFQYSVIIKSGFDLYTMREKASSWFRSHSLRESNAMVLIESPNQFHNLFALGASPIAEFEDTE